MIIKQDNDSIFISADTLFSARLSDLSKPKADTSIKKTTGKVAVKVNSKDSTNRYFEAYRNVRVFTDSLQAISDSLFYSFKDSIFRFYQQPVVWANKNQITGDTILLYTKNKKADRLQVFENSKIINQIEGDSYNQISSTRMDAYFKEGNIDSLRAKGLVESIYYLIDDDNAYTGVNESTADIMDIYFQKRELFKVVFRSDVKGTIWPIRQKKPSEMKIKNFSWKEDKRPKSRFELFE